MRLCPAVAGLTSLQIKQDSSVEYFAFSPFLLGLKKVSKDQMTHKNPELRGSSVVKASDTAPKAATAPKATAAVKKPPKFERRGNKWEVVSVLFGIFLKIKVANYRNVFPLRRTFLNVQI